ncbi:MAG: aminotransferase class III-fold pyridoxal phosphate-dependent enzyme [Planctomycetaceae bacterium]|nr:aminotransferase class III-fold pyridoxal phosphate-dependent enzyme [Planctomycetaceae bacterium]
MSLLELTPQFRPADVVRLAKEQFDLAVTVSRSLPGERDQNFHVTDSRQQSWVLKICNGGERPEFLIAQDRLMRHLAERVDGIPHSRATRSGEPLGTVRSPAGSHLVRLVEFLPGRPLADLTWRSPALLTDLGNRIGEVTTALAHFSDAAFDRDFQWDLRTAADTVRQSFAMIPAALQPAVKRCLADYDSHVLPRADRLPVSVIHNDANDGNVIVTTEKVTGLIDFGDAIRSWTISELAIAISYAIFHSHDPMRSATAVVAGYAAIRDISDDEIETLFTLMRLRLCLSAVVAAEQSQLRPDDEYLTVSQAPLQRVMPLLDAVPNRIATDFLRQAAGKGPRSQVSTTITWLQQHPAADVLPLSGSPDYVPIDLSAGSPRLTGSPAAWTCDSLQAVIDEFSRESGVAVGRYMEPRLLYADDHFAAASDDPADTFATERRTVHLGIDLFAPAGTPVCPAFAGIVHRVDDCPEPLDYGTLIILKHEPADGVFFYSLYGHLAPAVRVIVGQSVKPGEVIAELGDASENGGWPPHIHFQLATDLLQTDRNFPGVCRASEQSAWAWTCPDPSAVLRLPDATYPSIDTAREQCMQARTTAMPSSLATSYHTPLKIVRGHAHFLYSESGHRFLDAYNNVPHVGHCHPRVVNALQTQAAVLNTNTRYLHDGRQEFAAALTDTLPESLSVCLLVNSASEANELALRLARAATGGRDLIVLEGAYHGHSTTLIDISPYKHNGPGGKGAPDWVHTAPVADTFRGRYRDPENAGPQYATHVDRIISDLADRGGQLCGFIAESCPSVGGQIIFPPNYLSDVYASVRAAGGICIADEVQTGYGRLGRHFYGFEQQGVVPDMVVLGKPIGNGHPLAAVVTTPQIAAAFDTGMEFFSTFGGNTVSCAVGHEVLRTVLEDGLPQQAAETGDFLLAEFARLAREFPLIGDVRGSGLFQGLELVRDRQTLEPADQEASFIVERMKDQGILIGTDGPLHNVLKIRPPMTFDRSAAKTLVAAMRRAFLQLGK